MLAATAGTGEVAGGVLGRRMWQERPRRRAWRRTGDRRAGLRNRVGTAGRQRSPAPAACLWCWRSALSTAWSA